MAVLSPSWGGPSIFPRVYEHGLKVLQEWGLTIKEYQSTRADADFLRKNPQIRAQDINNAFADKEVVAIITSIGGNDSVRILPFLDKKVISENPKILMGFSDTSTVHTFCNQLGLITLYGPSVMAGFSQMESLEPAFKEHVHAMLFEPTERYEYSPYQSYCDGYSNWMQEENLGKVHQLKASSGWRWISGGGVVRGELFGGCMEVFEMMKATDFWPEKKFWKEKVFFLETSEEKPSLHQVDHALRNYGMLGVWDHVNAFIFGRARDYSDGEKKELEDLVTTVIVGEFGRTDMPIIANVDIGHTDPQFVLPLGGRVEIDCGDKKIALVEPWLL